MKIAIIGGGYTGLSAGYYLAKKGHEVVIYEERHIGGLGSSFKKDNWNWPLERYYHHWFSSDKDVLNLAKEVGQKMLTSKPKTSVYYEEKIVKFDNAPSVLRFPYLSVFERLRTGIAISIMKMLPYCAYLEKITAKTFIKFTMGTRSWHILWEPLFVKKFGRYTYNLPASWFWARIKKRTPKLVYPVGGFQSFLDRLVKEIDECKGTILLNVKVNEIKTHNNQVIVESGKERSVYDKVIVTTSFGLIGKLVNSFPKKYARQISRLKMLGAMNIVIELKKKLLKDDTYWLNVNDIKMPLLAVVEHTNFINKDNYGGSSIVYLANYIKYNNKKVKHEDKKLLEVYLPYLKKINPKFNKDWIVNYWIFKDNFAQPAVGLNYSCLVPGFSTPLKNVYIANMQQIYPWDRGINYSVKMGKDVASYVVGGCV